MVDPSLIRLVRRWSRLVLALGALAWLTGSWPVPPAPLERSTALSRPPSPPVTLSALIDGAASVAERKRRFLAYVLPLIDATNAAILADRAGVLRLQAEVAAGRPLAHAEGRWLAAIARSYGVATGDFAELLRRVDVVPPSLALAQAALESGWGTSRFAREGNALFGQRTWVVGAGLVPDERAAADRHEVGTFADLEDSVVAYMRNLNSHPAYAGFRVARLVLRGHGWLDGYVLAGTMTPYSEIGAGYVTRVRAIIRANGLADHDRTLLDG